MPPHEKPSIWLLIGDKIGDNAQVFALSEALGLPVEERRLTFKERWITGKPRFRPALHHVDLEKSDPLAPPWPDLIITVGRRPAMVALWIKRQSGGRARIVLIGRPRSYLRDFDLVIGTGQYLLPDRPNVLQLTLPLMKVEEEALQEAGRRWADYFSQMARPLTAVLVGGATHPFRFAAEQARELLAQVQKAAGERGSLFITTSRRTGKEATDALRKGLPENAHLFEWREEAPPEENPYLGLLACADRFVVTGDSISMMVEVAALGRPLAIAPLPLKGDPLTRARLALLAFARGSIGRALVAAVFSPLVRMGLTSYPRDFALFHQQLAESGIATHLEEGFRLPSGRSASPVAQAAEAVRALLERRS